MTQTSDDAATIAHYSASSSTGLQTRIDQAIVAAGLTADTVSIADLGVVDEFHVGGRNATRDVCAGLALDQRTRVLDVGCGIGGTARFLYAEYGCAVTGVDLTPEYVQVAARLSDMVCPEAALTFHNRSALDTGLAAKSFDAATQLHVGMNIADKPAVFREVFRLLRPGGGFVVYDLMGDRPDDLVYPVPWATDPSMSFVAGADAYARALRSAGFEISSTTDRTQAGLEAFAAQRRAAQGRSRPAPLGLHLVLGEDAANKLANLVPAVRDGVVSPIEIRCTKPR